MLVGFLVELVQQGEEGVRVVGCGLPTVAARVAGAPISAPAVS